MNYYTMPHRAWQDIIYDSDSACEDSDGEQFCGKLNVKTDSKCTNKITMNKNVQDNQFPSLSGLLQSTNNKQGSSIPDQQVKPEAAQDNPLSAEEQAALAAKEARSKALDEELEKYMSEPTDTIQPVPEDFKLFLDQLSCVNNQPEANVPLVPIPEPTIDFINDTVSSREFQVEPVKKSVFDPLPHTTIPNCKPMREQLQNKYLVSDNTIQSPHVHLCDQAMPEQDPCEGPSNSHKYNLARAPPETCYQQPQAEYEKYCHFNNRDGAQNMSTISDGRQTSYMTSQNVPIQKYRQAPAPDLPATPTLRELLSPQKPRPSEQSQVSTVHQKKDSPREQRNRAEKQRRDNLNQSIALLARIVPPVAAMGRKIDKTTIMKLTAHYLRSHQYVFGNSINNGRRFKTESTNAVLSLLKGFVLTVTYRGLIVVVSHNIRQLLGYSELDLIGTNVYSIIHKNDHDTFRDHLMPTSVILGKYGELLLPDDPSGADDVTHTLAREKKIFVVRFKKLVPRSDPPKYIMCHVEGSFRKADKASRYLNRCCQVVRRARTRGENPRSSGNDIVFIGVVRPLADTFMYESIMESFRMEYRTRHSVDGEIIHCDQRISLVTGYMTDEVSGVNAMNFMHRDDVRWVIVALREMYDQHSLFGESCYRLMAKNGDFIYMRTRGSLDVDENSKIATSFVCTNTVVTEEEGKHFIDLMKKRFNILVNNGANSIFARDENESYDENSVPVEDPRQLEKVILHLVNNLPSPDICKEDSFGLGNKRISIIPPKRERIVNAIKRIESVLYPRVIAGMENKRENERVVSSSTHSALNEENETADTEMPLHAYGMPHNIAEAFQMIENHQQFLSSTQPTQHVNSQVYTSAPMEFNTHVFNYGAETSAYNNDVPNENTNYLALPSCSFQTEPMPSTTVEAGNNICNDSSIDDYLAMCPSTGILFNSDDINTDRLTPFMYELDSLSSDSTDIDTSMTLEEMPQDQQHHEDNTQNSGSLAPVLEPLVLDPSWLDPHPTRYPHNLSTMDAYFARKLRIREGTSNQERSRKRRRSNVAANIPQNARNETTENGASNSTRQTVIHTPKGKGVGKRTQ